MNSNERLIDDVCEWCIHTLGSGHSGAGAGRGCGGEASGAGRGCGGEERGAEQEQRTQRRHAPAVLVHTLPAIKKI